MCIHSNKNTELHIDDTMEKIMAIGTEYTPKECYEYWYGRIHPDYASYVIESMDAMIRGDKAVQVEFPWLHPKLGDVMVRFSGRRAKNSGETVVLEGYYRIITDVTGA